MHGTWFVAATEEGPHLHFLAPGSAKDHTTPSAFACVLYTAAAVLTRYLATHHPECPFMVVTDPEPQYDGKHYIGCVHLYPWPGPAEQYVAEHPGCIEDYADMFLEHAQHFNADSTFCALIEPHEHPIEPSSVNAPGSENMN